MCLKSVKAALAAARGQRSLVLRAGEIIDWILALTRLLRQSRRVVAAAVLEAEGVQSRKLCLIQQPVAVAVELAHHSLCVVCDHATPQSSSKTE